MKIEDKKTVKQYNFFHWGPFLFHVKVTPEECDIVKQAATRCRNKNFDYQSKLAGHIHEEYDLGSEADTLASMFKKYFEIYCIGFNKWKGGGTMKPNFDFVALWVNFMKANEFNPPHDHNADLSFVFYPHIPKKITEECKNFKGTMRGPGGIGWFYGEGNHQCISVVHQMPEDGDLYIFPSNLKHWVFPFKSNATRISVSGNVLLDEDSRFSYYGKEYKGYEK